jgi:hypothetical protein
LVIPHAAGKYTDLVNKQAEEGFVDWLFKTDCYTQAVVKLDRECSKLDADSRQQLAYDATVCYLHEHGLEVPRCPKWSSPAECIRELVQAGKTQHIYTEFYSNIHR